MSEKLPPRELLEKAVLNRRWAALARADIDVGGIATWDETLDRRTRLLVPIDVQAFVVAGGGDAEPTVEVTGGPDDPPPFAPGTVRGRGVHLHWAMPDALLRGREGARPPESTAPARLEFPRLPDRWTVVRVLMPVGRRQALVRGWVIDAVSGAVSPLDSHAGTFTPPPGAQVLDPLDAAHGGSLMWTASYSASANRFAVHDPLDDLPGPQSPEAPDGFEGNHAVYVVAGWWSDLARDPLADSIGPSQLDRRLEQLGWLVVHDGDPGVLKVDEPLVSKARRGLGLVSKSDKPPMTVTGHDGHQKVSLKNLEIASTMPVKEATAVIMAPPLPRYATLLHGAILGVPLGALPARVDDRPRSEELGAALGQDIDDVVSAFGAAALGFPAEQRAQAERLAAAFTSDLLERIGAADGIADLEEREHGDGFSSLPGTPLPDAMPDRLLAEDGAPVGPTSVGRKGREAQNRNLGTKLQWKREVDLSAKKQFRKAARAEEATSAAPPPEARVVKRPAPRWFRPQPPTLAIRGAHPNHRHHGDGLFDQGRLRCRYPKECVPSFRGVVTGASIIPTLASSAVPDEVLTVVREAALLDPYGTRWLAAAGATGLPDRGAVFETRLAGEMVRLYGQEGRYDGVTRLSTTLPHATGEGGWTRISATSMVLDRQITAELARFSLAEGTPPSPVAITTWRQPWIPLWLEWQVTLEGSQRLEGWKLEAIDFTAGDDPGPAQDRTFSFRGRSPLGQGVTKAIEEGIKRWLAAEALRDDAFASVINDDDEAILARLGEFLHGDALHPTDLMSASLDGIREQLLGVDYVGCARVEPSGAGGRSRPAAAQLPTPLFGGVLRVDQLRLVDAFGRVLTVPTDKVATTLAQEVPDQPAAIRLPPRIQHQARWLWRLVDPALAPGADPSTAKEAFIDQLDPTLAVNPVAGFLLPDHIDEALEFWTADGQALGQLFHDPISGAVAWEPAPGRPVPPDAGPLAALTAHDRLAGELAAGLVRADVGGRNLPEPPVDSTLTTLLRAIDTTLWTVDTFASLGTPTVAGLVGRPIAIVRATLRLDAPDDLDEVTTTADGGEAARRQAFARLAEQRFPVKLGALQRSDDALLGFFVDDDYEHLHVVDKVVASDALDSGRSRGQLGLLGADAEAGQGPPPRPLHHPSYLVEDDTLFVRPGQTVRLTLLLLPAGKVHLTSGILPRKALALNHDWVAPGLERLMPSVRVGPLLVDPSEIRLPLINLLGDSQTFTRRTGPLTWRDDPIVAATQTALLPRMPHEVQEGWIRVKPEDLARQAEERKRKLAEAKKP